MKNQIHRYLFLIVVALAASCTLVRGQAFEVMVIQQEVGLRERPGFVYKETGRLLPGEEVIVDQVEGDWAHIAHMGWVPAGAVGRRSQAQHYRVTADPSARVRSGPGTSYEILGALDHGDTLDVVGEKDGWLELRDGSWIYGALAEPARAAAGPPASATPSGARPMVRVTADPRANLRAGPSTDEPVVGTAEGGEDLEVVDQRDGWLRLARGGWIYGDLVAPLERSGAHSGSARPQLSRIGEAELDQWGLLSLLGVYIKIVQVPDQSAVAQRTTQLLNKLTGQEREYTFMSIIVDVPRTTRYRFNFSPAYNRVQITDSSSRRFGNFVHKEGDLDRLPPEVRSLFQPAVVFPGNVHTGLLAFSGDLDPDHIEKIEVYISGRMQELYREN